MAYTTEKLAGKWPKIAGKGHILFARHVQFKENRLKGNPIWVVGQNDISLEIENKDKTKAGKTINEKLIREKEKTSKSTLSKILSHRISKHFLSKWNETQLLKPPSNVPPFIFFHSPSKNKSPNTDKQAWIIKRSSKKRKNHKN